MAKLFCIIVVIAVSLSDIFGESTIEDPIPIIFNEAHVYQPRYEPFHPLQKLLNLENGKYKEYFFCYDNLLLVRFS